MHEMGKLNFSLLVLTVILSCNIFDDSRNRILKQECDYEGIRKAILFSKEGSATTDNSIHLSLVGCFENIKENQTGSIFVADGNAVLDSTSVSFKWNGFDTLQVTYDSRLRIFKQ